MGQETRDMGIAAPSTENPYFMERDPNSSFPLVFLNLQHLSISQYTMGRLEAIKCFHVKKIKAALRGAWVRFTNL